MTDRVHRARRAFALLPVALALSIVAAIAFLLARESAMGVELSAARARVDEAGYVAEAGLAHAMWLTQRSGCSGYADLPSTTFFGHSYSATLSRTTGSPVGIDATGTLSNGTTRTLRRAGLAVYGTPGVVRLQPGAAGEDAYISETEPSANSGTSDDLRMKNTADAQNVLVRFDLSALPTSARVTSATVELYLAQMSSNGIFDLGAYRVTKAWNEAEVTWLQASAGVPWTAAGGDAEPVATASTAVDRAAVPRWVSWNVTSAVADWVAGRTPNHGLLLRGAAGVNNARFASSDGPTPVLHPKLTIAVACECGVGCDFPSVACNGNYAPDTQVGSWDPTAYADPRGIAFLPSGLVVNGVAIPEGGGWAMVEDTAASTRVVIADIRGAFLTEFTLALAAGSRLSGVSYVDSGTHVGKLVYSVTNGAADILLSDLDGAVTDAWDLGAILPLRGIAFVGDGSYAGHFFASLQSAGVVVDENGSSVGNLTYPTGVTDVRSILHLAGGDLLAIHDSQTQALHVLQVQGVLPALTSTSMNQSPLSQFESLPGQPPAGGIGHHPVTCNYALLDRDAARVVLVNAVGGGTPPPGPGSPQVETAVADTWIGAQFPDSSAGTAPQLRIGREAGGQEQLGLVRFDVSSVPAGATITTATLRLYKEEVAGSGTHNFDVHRVTAAWDEGTATWTSVGSSFDPTPLATTSVPLTAAEWTEWAIPPGLVHEWIDGVQPNHGLLVRYPGAIANREIRPASREHSASAWRPQLVLVYTTP